MADKAEVRKALEVLAHDLNLVLTGQYPMGLGAAQHHGRTEAAWVRVVTYVQETLNCDCEKTNGDDNVRGEGGTAPDAAVEQRETGSVDEPG